MRAASLRAIAAVSPDADAARRILAEADHIESYEAARAYFGTSASYMVREFCSTMRDPWPDGESQPCSGSWLCERAMVALWNAMGRPVKGSR